VLQDIGGQDRDGERSIVKDEKHTDRSQQKNAKTKRWLGQPQLPMMINPWISFTSTLYTIVHLCRHSQRKSTRKPPAGRHGPTCRKRHGLRGGPPPPQRCSPLRLLRGLGSGPAQWGKVAMAHQAHGGPWWAMVAIISKIFGLTGAI